MASLMGEHLAQQGVFGVLHEKYAPLAGHGVL
jgi:hypothetical protein